MGSYYYTIAPDFIGGGGGTVVLPGEDTDSPVSYTPFSDFDWLAQPQPDYTAVDGSRLEYHHEGHRDERVITPALVSDCAGSLNGYACEISARKPPDSVYLTGDYQAVKDYVRAELKIRDLPTAYTARDNQYFKLDQEYVLRWRMKISEAWEIDTITQKGTDAGDSIIEFKQDIYAGDLQRVRDATFRLRFCGKDMLIVLNANQDFGENEGGVNEIKYRKRLPLPDLFDRQWHTFTVYAKFSPNFQGFIYLYFDGLRIWNYSGTTAYNDFFGPYCKFGIYNGTWKAMNAGEAYRDTGSTKHVAYWDYFRIGIPD